ncbi:MAG: Crp/Fnr family transcriptional regulator [Saprospiraceae bacterium]|nr:Crp/Fnr family transcriptional regulator [Saprospiraceae bacterium]MBP8086443.1 Crp/Fnr family transcriptional regulator [Saprospiraceae bacterium]
MKKLKEIIDSIHPLTPKAYEAFLGICTPMTVKKNADLQSIGQICKSIYFIKKGALRVYYYKGETDITDSLEFEGAFVARVESLVTGQPSKKGIQAIEDCELIVINTDKLYALYDSYLEIERLFKQLFLKAFIGILNRIESIQFHSAEVRYANFLKEYPDALKRVPLKYIASYLGITQVSLSRIRAKY